MIETKLLRWTAASGRQYQMAAEDTLVVLKSVQVLVIVTPLQQATVVTFSGCDEDISLVVGATKNGSRG